MCLNNTPKHFSFFLFLQKQPQQFARRNDLSVKKYCQEKTPTSHFERWLCSDTQKAASVSKVRAFQETGSTLPSALSLFISLPFPHLSLSLCSREPLCLSRRSITSRALRRPFSSELLSPLLSPFPLRPPHFFLLFFYPQISQNGRQN